MYIKVKDTKYKLISYYEDVRDVEDAGNIVGECPQILYTQMVIDFNGDVLTLRKEIRDQLKEDKQTCIIYNDDDTIAFSYAPAYQRFVRRIVNVDTGSFNNIEISVKVYLDHE